MTFFLRDDGADRVGDGLTGGLATAADGFGAVWRSTSMSEGFLNFELGRKNGVVRREIADSIRSRVGLDALNDYLEATNAYQVNFGTMAGAMPRPQSVEEAVGTYGVDALLGAARQLAEQDPAAWSDVDLSDEGIDAEARRRIRVEYEQLALDAALSPTSTFGRLAASFGSSIFNIKTLPWLVGGLGGAGVKTILGVATREAAINTAIEGTLLPSQYDAAETLGIAAPGVVNELTQAAVIGAAFGATAEALVRGLSYIGTRGATVPGVDPVRQEAFTNGAADILMTSDNPGQEAAVLARRMMAVEAEEAATRGLEVLDNDAIMAVRTNADLFQYKDGGDAQGVTDRLQQIEAWDNNRTGIALIYEYRDGRREIVDGHQRLGLANRMIAKGQQVELPARILREVDGITPAMARQIGAEKNIAEGTGTALDAAKVIRESGATAAQLNLPAASQLVRDADGLARLSDDGFRMVINGVVPERTAAVVGRLVGDQARHVDILGLLARLKPTNAVQTESIVRQAAAAEVRETQATLFGDEDVSVNLYMERAKVLDQALKDLGRDITTFRTLDTRGETITSAGNVLNPEANASRLTADERARASLMRQANTKGPVSDALTAAARSVKDGGKVTDAARQFVSNFRARDGAEGSGPITGGSGDGARPAQAARQSEQTAIGEQFLVDQPGIRPDPDRPGLINTRGQGIRFHGSRGKKLNQNLDEGAYSSLNYYGQGFYTTDAVAIAEGYDKGGGIYVVNEIRPVNAFDMEQPIPDFLRAAANSIEGDAEGVVQAALDETRPTVREFYDEIREYSRSYQVPADDVQGVFEVFEYVFKENGFNALDHRGGVLSKKAEHSVRIYFDPHNTVEVRPIDKSEFSMPVATERTAAGEQTLVVGVAPIRPVDRLETMQNAPMTGRALPADGGLFDLAAREQLDWVSQPGAAEREALFDNPASPQADALYSQMASDVRAQIEADTTLTPEERASIQSDLDELDLEEANLALAKMCGMGS